MNTYVYMHIHISLALSLSLSLSLSLYIYISIYMLDCLGKATTLASNLQPPAAAVPPRPEANIVSYHIISYDMI